jgi:hypothetical protein
VIGTILFLPPMTLLFMMALQGNKHATTYEAVRAKPIRLDSRRQRLSYDCNKPSDLFAILQSKFIWTIKREKLVTGILLFLALFLCLSK